jgi:hypothetical protein
MDRLVREMKQEFIIIKIILVSLVLIMPLKINISVLAWM